MQVDNAAPMPVPVHIRTPRLYNVEVFETPANWKFVTNRPHGSVKGGVLTFNSRVQSA